MVSMTKAYASKIYLENYIKEHNIDNISDLFTKETLIELSSDAEWEWSINDEMITGCSEEEAQTKTRKWYESMTKLELWQDHLTTYNQNCLIEDMAEELGFSTDNQLSQTQENENVIVHNMRRKGR